ncbi:hypothetical protein Bca4012_075588 [Brassica carinata]
MRQAIERPQDMQRWKQSMNLLDNGKKIDFDLYVTCEPCIMCASTLSFLVKKLKEEKGTSAEE